MASRLTFERMIAAALAPNPAPQLKPKDPIHEKATAAAIAALDLPPAVAGTKRRKPFEPPAPPTIIGIAGRGGEGMGVIVLPPVDSEAIGAARVATMPRNNATTHLGSLEAAAPSILAAIGAAKRPCPAPDAAKTATAAPAAAKEVDIGLDLERFSLGDGSA